MTDISPQITTYQVENRSWLLSQHGTEGPLSITLDVSTFTPATHYPNGYLQSGMALAQLAATGLYVPYVDGGAGGIGVCKGLLFSSVKIPSELDPSVDVGAALLSHGFVSLSKLPIALDAAGQADLSQIHFSA